MEYPLGSLVRSLCVVTTKPSIGQSNSSGKTFFKSNGLLIQSSTWRGKPGNCGGSRLVRFLRSVKMSGDWWGQVILSGGGRRWLRILLSCWPWWWFILSEISVSGSGGGDSLGAVSLVRNVKLMLWRLFNTWSILSQLNFYRNKKVQYLSWSPEVFYQCHNYPLTPHYHWLVHLMFWTLLTQSSSSADSWGGERFRRLHWEGKARHSAENEPVNLIPVSRTLVTLEADF